MLTNENLLDEALNKLPSFNSKYHELIAKDEIDNNSGNHIVFNYAFVPLLEEYITNKNIEGMNLFLGFLEEMASSDDYEVNEVCDYSILEQLHDDIPDIKLFPLLGEKSKQGFLAIRQYTEATN